MSACEFSLAVPLYNEEDCVRPAITELLRSLDQSGVAYELIAVNNGSRDRTGPLLDELAKTHQGLRVVHVQRNLGYGGAILEGWRVSSGQVLGFTCGDGEVSSEDVVALYRILRAGALDFVKGKRIDRCDGVVRKIYSVGYHLWVGLLLQLHITDINGYPVLMTRDAYDKINPTITDWLINVDLLLGARRTELRIAEVDVCHRQRLGGRSHVRAWFPLLFLYQLLRFRLRTRGVPPAATPAAGS